VHPGTIQYLVISKETFGLTSATYDAKIKVGNAREDLYKWITFAPLQRKFDFHATVQELREAQEKKAKQPPESAIITISVECKNATDPKQEVEFNIEVYNNKPRVVNNVEDARFKMGKQY